MKQTPTRAPPQPRWAPRTLAAQALGHVDPATKAIVPPLHAATTFLRDPDNQYRSGFAYGRPDNATVRQVEQLMVALERGREGLLFGSGMAAATAVILALPPASHIVASQVMYWALRDWLAREATRLGYRLSLVDSTDLAAVKAAVRPGETRLIWIETPANPLWSITDIAAVADIAHERHAVLAVDSTAASPVLTRPLTLGADIVMHSATKYLNGHSDVIAGVLVTAEPEELWSRITTIRTAYGGVVGPFEAWLLLRGLRTLDVRVRAQSLSAMRLAVRFKEHSLVTEVLYPGLEHCRGHAVAAQQMVGGFGGMLSLRVSGGERSAILTAASVELWKRATSLGGVESLIEHRASVEGPESPCPADLLRLSVGLEDPDDLYADLDRALRLAGA